MVVLILSPLSQCLKTYGGPEAFSPITVFERYGGKTSLGWQMCYVLMTHFELYYTNMYTHIYVSKVRSSFNCFHLRKGLYSKRHKFCNVILHAVSHIVLLRCRLIYIYVCVYTYCL